MELGRPSSPVPMASTRACRMTSEIRYTKAPRYDVRVMSALAPLGRSILTDRAYAAIKRAILSLELGPGTRLVERRLAEEFQVSKSPVRDALQRLAGEGLVVQTPYAGMVVREFDPAFVDELYQVREDLEVMAIRLASPRLTAADVADAEESFRDAETAMRADDAAARTAASARFHSIFYRRSENRPLCDILAGLSDMVSIISALNWRAHDTRWESHRQHQAIFEAALAGDVLTASELMRAHVGRGRTEYWRAFEALRHDGGKPPVSLPTPRP